MISAQRHAEVHSGHKLDTFQYVGCQKKSHIGLQKIIENAKSPFNYTKKE